uniref:Uncharacterized protein n=1 Tax=Anopheles melas TaxID=34690 RepID=A0A182TTB4_9DIPT
MGNRLGALLGIEKSPGSSGGGDGGGDGGSSKNYNLIESRAHNPPPSRHGGQSTVEQATVSPGSRLQRVRSFFLPSASSRRREGSEEPPPFGGRSGSRRRFRFYTIRRRTTGQQEQQQQQQQPSIVKDAAFDVGDGEKATGVLEGDVNESLLPAGQQNAQRTNQWIHRLPLMDEGPKEEKSGGELVVVVDAAVVESAGETKVCFGARCTERTRGKVLQNAAFPPIYCAKPKILGSESEISVILGTKLE